MTGSRVVALAVIGLVVGGCGPDAGRAEPDYPKKVVDDEALTRCFAAAYDASNTEASIDRCERDHFGTEWRREPSRAAGEGGGMTSFSATGTGNLDPRLVNAIIQSQYHRMRACYRAAVRRAPDLRAADVRIRFVIDPGGRATGAEDAASKTKDRQLVECVRKELGSLRFPRPENGPVTVLYPMIFGAGDLHHGAR